MITQLQDGTYRLIETKHHHKILYLDDNAYAWINPIRIGEILVASYTTHKTDCVLSVGRYRIYQVEDESSYSDQLHLELEVGTGQWQGYLLLSGLPNEQHKRKRMIPTHETIANRPRLRPTAQAMPQ